MDRKEGDVNRTVDATPPDWEYTYTFHCSKCKLGFNVESRCQDHEALCTVVPVEEEDGLADDGDGGAEGGEGEGENGEEEEENGEEEEWKFYCKHCNRSTFCDEPGDTVRRA